MPFGIDLVLFGLFCKDLVESDMLAIYSSRFRNGVLGGIQTPDLQDRNLLLYSAELRALIWQIGKSMGKLSNLLLKAFVLIAFC